MPKILSTAVIDGKLWIYIGRPGSLLDGMAFWTPEEQEAIKRDAAAAERERIEKLLFDQRLFVSANYLRELTPAAESPPKPQSFREFYSARHADWPGLGGEDYSNVFLRLADTFADFVDERLGTGK